jgi:aminocarboxymuconate-semialdehyde decarboxylase
MTKQSTKKIALGTDYPFPLGDLHIGQFIEEMQLEQSDLENIMHGSALEWLDLPKSFFS